MDHHVAEALFELAHVPRPGVARAQMLVNPLANFRGERFGLLGGDAAGAHHEQVLEVFWRFVELLA